MHNDSEGHLGLYYGLTGFRFGGVSRVTHGVIQGSRL